MRALLTSLTLISAISLSSAAFAASTTTGTIGALDTGFKDPGLKVGEKVTIAYEMIGKKHQATAITGSSHEFS